MRLLVLRFDFYRRIGQTLDDIGENLTGNDAAARLLDVGTGGVLDGDFKIGRLEDELSLIGGLEQDAREDGEGRARRHAL